MQQARWQFGILAAVASAACGLVAWTGIAAGPTLARTVGPLPVAAASGTGAGRPSHNMAGDAPPPFITPRIYKRPTLLNVTLRPPGVPLAMLYVDRNGNCPNTPCYTTIQAAVTAANPGDTINVTAGLYYETVTVNKSLILRGAQAGNDARIGRTNETNETVLNRDTGGFDLTSGPSNVTIDGFLIEGASGPNGNARGIFILGGSGYQILNNILRYNSMGAFFSSDGTVQTRFYRNRVENNNNTPTGDGDTGLFGGNGLVNNVLIDSNQFTGHTSSAITNVPSSPSTNLVVSNNSSTNDGTFIALFNANATQILSNTVTGAQGSAIFVGGNTDGTLINGNSVRSGPFSALRVTVFPGNSPNSNITANCNNLTANGYGIRISAGSLLTTTQAMQAHNNNIVGNTVAGARNDSTAVDLNATLDWWGSATGPTNPANPGGTGDVVTGTVTFAPYLINPASCVSGTPQPSPTATNTATATSTATVPATTTATLTVTVAPSSTATPTVTVALSSTAIPTTTVLPSSTAGATVLPSATGVPTGTLTATGTSVPTVISTPPPGATATGTVGATATSCPIRFSDVTDLTAYYYQGVYYLACHGVISGYADGTYKPFNNTTRAQMTKIVTLAFNMALVPPPTVGTFTDVTSDNVFYQLIETAVAHGSVSGYDCGGVNAQSGTPEPCDSGRRPYFRPSNFVTRGQLAKIVVLGAGWTLHNPTNPTFTDVDRAHVFYQVIETAVCHGVVSGYSENTFRPNNYAFRGQIAKIVYLAVTGSVAVCTP